MNGCVCEIKLLRGKYVDDPVLVIRYTFFVNGGFVEYYTYILLYQGHNRYRRVKVYDYGCYCYWTGRWR